MTRLLWLNIRSKPTGVDVVGTLDSGVQGQSPWSRSQVFWKLLSIWASKGDDKGNPSSKIAIRMCGWWFNLFDVL